MTGLQKILKIHGEIKVNDVVWVWDYFDNKPVLKSEMTAAEYADNKKFHKGKGEIKRVALDKIEYGKTPKG